MEVERNGGMARKRVGPDKSEERREMREEWKKAMAQKRGGPEERGKQRAEKRKKRNTSTQDRRLDRRQDEA